jgi:uncharacterized protein YceK
MKHIGLGIVMVLLLTACGSVYNNTVSILSYSSTIDDVQTKRFKQGFKND